MERKKIYVVEVLSQTKEFDVAHVRMGDRRLQICFPKKCDITKYVGKEVFYEFDRGVVRLSDMFTTKREKPSTDEKEEGGE